eukprot:3739787-Pleurochrysis_carterae.AAC.1
MSKQRLTDLMATKNAEKRKRTVIHFVKSARSPDKPLPRIRVRPILLTHCTSSRIQLCSQQTSERSCLLCRRCNFRGRESVAVLRAVASVMAGPISQPRWHRQMAHATSMAAAAAGLMVLTVAYCHLCGLLEEGQDLGADGGGVGRGRVGGGGEQCARRWRGEPLERVLRVVLNRLRRGWRDTLSKPLPDTKLLHFTGSSTRCKRVNAGILPFPVICSYAYMDSRPHDAQSEGPNGPHEHEVNMLLSRRLHSVAEAQPRASETQAIEWIHTRTQRDAAPLNPQRQRPQMQRVETGTARTH